jgi:hypothetical protein
MPYARILALIDAEVARLQRARQLLASTYAPIKKIKKGAAPTSVTPRPAAPDVVEREMVAAPQKSPIAAATVAKTRRKRTRLSPRKERPAIVKTAVVDSEPKALGGVVPATPVFVSAEQIRQAQVQKQPDPEQSDLAPAATDSLTAEMLKQKWLRSTAS